MGNKGIMLAVKSLPSSRVFHGEEIGHSSKCGLGGQTDLTLNPDLAISCVTLDNLLKLPYTFLYL